MRTSLAILLSTLLVASAAGMAAAEGRDHAETSPEARHADGESRHAGHPEARPHGDQLLFHNDNVAVLFHQDKEHAAPDFRVVFNGSADDEKAGYRVQILSLYEANRTDTRGGHGLPRDDLARMADWNVQSVEGNDSLTLTMVRADAQAITTLVWHLNTASRSVKFDLHVDNWRWADPNDVLILDTRVSGHDLRNATGSRIDVEDAGYITWADTATATYANGTGALHVRAFQGKLQPMDGANATEDGAQHAQTEGKGGHLYLVFDGPGGYSKLAYDPELGVSTQSDSVQTVPFMAPLFVAAAIVGVALLVARRR